MRNQINKITISLIFCSLFSLTYAQNIDNGLNLELDAIKQRILTTNDASSEVKADGSPYIDANFTSIRITQFKDKIYSARYNAFNNEMEVLIEDNKVIVLDPKSEYEVTFTSTNKVYRAVSFVTDNDISKNEFLVVLSKNEKHILFKEERIKFQEKVEAKTSYDKEKPAKYKRIDNNYYIKLDDKLTFLPQKKKDFLKLFPNETNELSSYMKKNKLNPKNEDELIIITEYLASIVD